MFHVTHMLDCPTHHDIIFRKPRVQFGSSLLCYHANEKVATNEHPPLPPAKGDTLPPELSGARQQ